MKQIRRKCKAFACLSKMTRQSPLAKQQGQGLADHNEELAGVISANLITGPGYVDITIGELYRLNSNDPDNEIDTLAGIVYDFYHTDPGAECEYTEYGNILREIVLIE